MINKNKLPHPTGPYSTGFLDFEVPAEPETFGEHDTKRNGKITLTIQTIHFSLFYPVELSHSEAAKYHRPDWLPSPQLHNAHGYSLSTGLPDGITWPFSLVIWAKTANLKVKAYEGAPLLQTDSRLPVIIFSHGLDGSSRVYSSMLIDWASHGFVVISVDHRDGSAPRAYIDPNKIPPDATDDPKIRTVTRNGRKWRLRSYLVPIKAAYSGKGAPDWQNPHDTSLILRRCQMQMRVTEAIQALEAVKRLDKGELDHTALVDLWAKHRRHASLEARQNVISMFKGRLQLETNVVAAGHSFGGATCVELVRIIAAKHLPITCAILLDPWTQITPAPPDEYIPPHFDRRKTHPIRLEVPAEVRNMRHGIQVPLLTISSTFFQRWDEVRPYTMAICEEAGYSVKRCISIEVEGSNHIAQSDASLINRKALWFTPGVMTADAFKVMRLNRKATAEFMGRALDMSSLEQRALEDGHSRERGKSALSGEIKGIKVHYSIWEPAHKVHVL